MDPGYAVAETPAGAASERLTEACADMEDSTPDGDIDVTV
jgi:hypothetical protein